MSAKIEELFYNAFMFQIKSLVCLVSMFLLNLPRFYVYDRNSLASMFLIISPTEH